MTFTISGHWYDGQQSRQQPATLVVDDQGFTEVVAADTGQRLFSGEFAQLSVSGRLGNTGRYVYFPDGQKFESRDNDQLDQALGRFQPQGLNSWLYRLETRWRYVLVATLMMVGVVYWTTVYGVPAAAKLIAAVMPQELMDKAGKQTLAFLDEQMFEPSTLTPAVQQRIRDHFAPIIADHPDLTINLHFRSSEIGANAFALPDGSIIFTDDMVELAISDDELLAVMAHEMGHVVHRHGMRSVVQGSLISFTLMLMTGDISAASELFLAIPVILTQLGYSRDFEREADDYALDYLREQQLDPGNFSRLMARLQQDFCEGDSGDDSNNDNTASLPENCEAADWQRYLSTHPGITERIEKFEPATAASQD